MAGDGRDEEADSPTSDSIEPRHRLMLRILLYTAVTMVLIYLGCEIAVYLFHIRPSPNAAVVLPALV